MSLVIGWKLFMNPSKLDDRISADHVNEIYKFFNKCVTKYKSNKFDYHHEMFRIGYHLAVFDKREITSKDGLGDNFDPILYGEIIVNYYNPLNKPIVCSSNKCYGIDEVCYPQYKNRECEFTFTYPLSIFLESIQKNLGVQ